MGRGCCLVVLIVLVAAVVVAVVSVKKKPHTLAKSPSPGGVKTYEKYSDALDVALRFFQIQKSGKLVNNKITWRGDSALNDGKEAGLDLSKGMYDAGDHMKFGLPMAFTATILSWGILEYGNNMENGQLPNALDSLRWITDYLINAHPSKSVLYIQVGDPEIDHACWERPETMTEKRPLTKIDAKTPGSEVAAETAAAMASASLVFRKKDPKYSELLLKHAVDLFSFADTTRGSYTASFPKIQKYYNSTGFGDELLWAASWLYLATKNRLYLNYVTGPNAASFAQWRKPTFFSWDIKNAGTQVLLSRVEFFDATIGAVPKEIRAYRETAEAVMCVLLPDSSAATLSRTEDGLLWVSQWNALMHSAGSAFLALLYSDYMLLSKRHSISCDGEPFTPDDLRQFAISQADYILGDNPMRLSYLVGYGSTYPQRVHHRGASIRSNATTGCKGFQWLDSDEDNPNVAVGALVGGPFKNDTYIDDRDNSMQGEPTTYNSALLTGLLSGLISYAKIPRTFM